MKTAYKYQESEINSMQPYSHITEETFHVRSNMRQLKPSWRQIKKLARKKGINLYHFTDRSNIQLIKEQGGLYSWAALKSKGIQVPCPGGSELSRRLDLGKNLHDYVRLCLHPNQPMKYVACRDGRIPNPTILKIDPEVLLWSTTLYSNINAAAGNATIGGTFNDFSKIDFDLCNSGRWTCEREKHYFQAEILIKNFLPIEFILNIDNF